VTLSCPLCTQVGRVELDKEVMKQENHFTKTMSDGRFYLAKSIQLQKNKYIEDNVSPIHLL